MPDELSVKVKVVADTSGSEEVSKSLKKVSGVATGTKASFGRLGKGATDLRRLFVLLTNQFPLLGIAARAAFSPIGAIITGAVVGYTYFRKEIQKTNEELDNFASAISGPVSERVKAHGEAVRKALESMAEYKTALANIGKGEDEIKTSLDRQDELFQAEVAGRKLLIEAIGKQEEAEASLNATKMGFSPEKTEGILAGIKAKTGLALSAIDRSSAGRKYSRLEEEKSMREGDQQKYADEAHVAAVKQIEAATNLNDVTIQLANLKRNIDALSPILAQKKAEAGAGPTAAFVGRLGAESMQELEAAKQAEQARLDKEAASVQGLMDKFTKLSGQITKEGGGLDRATQNKAEADNTLLNARAREKTNLTRLNQIPGEKQQAFQIGAISGSYESKAAGVNLLADAENRLAEARKKSAKTQSDMAEASISGKNISLLKQRLAEQDALTAELTRSINSLRSQKANLRTQ
jgi:hypothetical protein